jgi:protein-tyrosine phosphatase
VGAVRLWTVPVGPGAVSVISRPLGDELLLAEAEDLRQAGATVLVSLLTHEELPVLGLLDEELVAPFVGLSFFHLPTPDQQPPARDEATLALATDLGHRARAGGHVAVHCRAGQGRSPAFACAVLVRAGRSADDAMHDMSQARGLAVPHHEAQRAWVRWVHQQPTT